jgi:sulfatase maturation enzyme AslB (radical SAM superfamily)
MKQNTFCKALSNAVSFKVRDNGSDLTFNPCCFYDVHLPFNATVFKEERTRFINAATFLPACSKCKLNEKTHGRSLRLGSNKEIPNGIDDTIYKLEIVLDTTCNAACIQCSEIQSSLWRKEISRDNRILHIQSESQIDKSIRSVKENIDLNKVKMFHFWGGEPLLTDTHLKFLREIDDPSEVQLNYTTNCSIFPDDNVLKLWEKFKKVRISLSIDGVEEQFHYIRWPLKWDKATRNVKLFKENTTSNVSFQVNCCIIPLNVYYVDILSDWLNENFDINQDGTKVLHNFIRGQGALDIACTPRSLREQVWKKIGINHDVSRVLREVPVIDYDNMLLRLKTWDPIRKLDWTTTFKEIVPYFKL